MGKKEKKLVLECTVKCGWKDLFITEKNLIINIDFLADPNFYKDLDEIRDKKAGKKRKKDDFKAPTREELIETYYNNPIDILYDADLFNLTRKNISNCFRDEYFPDLDFSSGTYPELFKLSDVKIKLIDDSEYAKLGLGPRDADIIRDEAGEFEDEYSFEMEQEEPSETEEYRVENGIKYYKA